MTSGFGTPLSMEHELYNSADYPTEVDMYSFAIVF
jgi:hypothetical protein